MNDKADTATLPLPCSPQEEEYRFSLIFPTISMANTFENKVRSAAIAGWWTLLIAAILLTLMWFCYLFMTMSQPAWVLPLMGSGVTWPMLQNVVFWMVGILKLCLWLMAFVVIWLTLWARGLRKGK